MDRLGVLVRGELDRLNKYGLFKATTVVTLLWIGVAWFMGEAELEVFVPLIFLMESTMMALLLVGATMFYEKKENTMNSLMVTPVTGQEYLASKIIMSIINSMITVVVISAAIYFIKGMTFNYLFLVPAMLLVTVVHTLIGIKIAYHSLNFSSMLVNYIVYIFVFMIPAILAMFDVIRGLAADFLILLPPEASNIVLSASFGDVETWRLLAAYGYLLVFAFVLYKYMVKPGLSNYANRETGV